MDTQNNNNQSMIKPLIDVSSLWNSVKNNTEQATATNGLLSSDTISQIAKSLLANVLGNLAKSSQTQQSQPGAQAQQNSGLGFDLSKIDLSGILGQLGSLYNQYAQSKNSTESTAATNVKSISDILKSVQNAGALINIGREILGGNNQSNGQSGNILGSVLGSILGGSSANNTQQQPQQSSGADILGSVLGSVLGANSQNNQQTQQNQQQNNTGADILGNVLGSIFGGKK